MQRESPGGPDPISTAWAPEIRGAGIGERRSDDAGRIVHADGGREKPRDPLELPRLPAENDFWSGTSWPDAEGKIVWHAPRGLTRAGIHSSGFATNPNRVARFRIGAGTPLRNSSEVSLETLDRDFRDIEIIRYESPTLLMKVVGGDGATLREARVTARYPKGRSPGAVRRTLGIGRDTDVTFWKQDDGRFRSTQLLPDETLTIRAAAEGYRERSETLTLPEGAVKELELVLEKP